MSPDPVQKLPAPYDARWQALAARLTHYRRRLQSAAAAPARKRDEAGAYALRTLAATAQRLQAFAVKHLRFFNSGAASAHVPPGYSRDYALALALHQVGFDVEVLEQAAHQRLNPLDAADPAVLANADRLARHAVDAAKAAALLPADATALTYFQKSPVIRVIPYAPVALLGVPYSLRQVPRDSLSIPHDVGHAVYWNSPAVADGLPEALPAWLGGHPAGSWIEEVFADLFSARVAGPVAAYSLQDLLFRQGDDTFLTHDGDHPIPALRPFIYSHLYARNGQRRAARALSRAWRRRLKGRFGREAVVVALGLGARAAIDDLISAEAPPALAKPLDRLIDEVERVLGGVRAAPVWAGPFAEAGAQAEAGPAEAEYRELNKRVARVAEVPERAEVREAADPWSAWAERIAPEPGRRLTRAQWLALAQGRGWTPEYPGNWPTSGQ